MMKLRIKSDDSGHLRGIKRPGTHADRIKFCVDQQTRNSKIKKNLENLPN